MEAGKQALLLYSNHTHCPLPHPGGLTDSEDTMFSIFQAQIYLSRDMVSTFSPAFEAVLQTWPVAHYDPQVFFSHSVTNQ